MRNRFAAPCYRCGETVQPNEGHFEKFSSKVHGRKWPDAIVMDRKWLTQHASCAIKFRGTDRHYKYNKDARRPELGEER